MSDAITPFQISASDEELDDLRRRLQNTRWPEAETPDDWTQGIPLAYVQEVSAYWAEKYDWRAREAALNRFPQFKTEIDGLGIHFIHARSPHENALPLVITHGWPGSVVEFQKVIEPLSDPTAHGGDAERRLPRRVSVAAGLRLLRQAHRPTAGGWARSRRRLERS